MVAVGLQVRIERNQKSSKTASKLVNFPNLAGKSNNRNYLGHSSELYLMSQDLVVN